MSLSTDCEKLMKNRGPHCIVRPRTMTVASGLDITTLEPNKIFMVTMYNIYIAAPWWSCSGTFRGCATGYSLVRSWSFACRQAAGGTLGGGCMKQSLPFHYTMKWSFLLRLGWCFELSFKSHEVSLAGCLWLTVWFLWTAAGDSWNAAGDTIGLFGSSSCLYGKDIAHCTGRVWCWSALDLCITLKHVGS